MKQLLLSNKTSVLKFKEVPNNNNNTINNRLLMKVPPTLSDIIGLAHLTFAEQGVKMAKNRNK